MRVTLSYLKYNCEYMVKVADKGKINYHYFDYKEDAISYIKEVKENEKHRFRTIKKTN